MHGAPPPPPPVSFPMSFLSYMSFPPVSIIVILDSGYAYIQVCKAKFVCDWGPIMLQPLNMYLFKDSFSPQEFYFLHSDVGKEIMW